MLDRIQSNQSDAISQSGLSKVSSIGEANSYNTKNSGLFIDESEISNDAIALYERDLDIQKFAKLAISDPEDNSAQKLVASGVLNGDFSIDDEDALFELLSNEDFLNDLAS